MGKILTKEIAQKLLGKADSADLSKYSELDEAAAKILAAFPCYLDLKGLKSLTDKAARALLPHESGLYLNGLQEITGSLASILSKYQGCDLRLGGIKKISDSAARTLSKFKESLSLGLTELSDKQAGFLGKHFSDNSGLLSLGKLKTLSVGAARSLGKHKGGCLCLDGIAELSDEAVFGLVQSEALSLNGLRKISDTALETLISYHMEGGTLYILTLRERFLAAKAKRAEGIAIKKTGTKMKS